MDTEKNNFSPLRKISEENDSEFFKIINIENEINSEFIIKNENETEEKKNNEKNEKEKKIRVIKQKYRRKKRNKKGKKIYKCICGKEFHTKENQKLHFQNIHLKQKPYKCSFCDCRFSHRNGKTYHERIFHTFILPYKCNFEGCKCQFASKSALNYHIKNKHSM